MSEQFTPIPSMTALRAFEAAARHLSFTGAASELEQTQGAVSHQIRELESRLGVRLFERRARGITLTEVGSTYLVHVREALNSLRAGAYSLQPKTNSNVLTVSCSSNFAQKWLVPRMGSFIAQNPQMDLRISASAQHVNFVDDDIDIAIRHGNGHWPQLSVTQLCKETVFPVCSPHLIPEGASPTNVEDLKDYVLIHDEQREGWLNWFRETNVDPSGFDLERGPVLSQTSFAIDAAIATRGVALARSALVELDLKEGRLIRPVTQEINAPFSYWVVCPKGSEFSPNIQRFMEWLIAVRE